MRLRGHAGSADAVGLAMLAPAMVGLALTILFLGRGVDARATVHGAAESAAQAAARERSPAAAAHAANRVGQAMLADHVSCAEPEFRVDLADFAPGGIVEVTVTCTPGTDGLEMVARRSHRYTATASATVDRFRAVEDAP